MGKMGLLRHVAAELKRQKIVRFYIDTYSCTDLKQFTDLLITNILQAFTPKSNLAERILGFIKSLRPCLAMMPSLAHPK